MVELQSDAPRVIHRRKHDVEPTWRHLKPLIPSDMDHFSSYNEKTCIGTFSQNSNFAPAMWKQYDASQMLIPRSTNKAEGWHRGFNSMMSCSNPTLWKFIDCLRAEQSHADADFSESDQNPELLSEYVTTSIYRGL